MKIITKIYQILILVLLVNSTYAQVSVFTFKVKSEYLQGDKILIKNTPSTEIKIEVQFETRRDNQGNPLPGKIQVVLATKNTNDEVVLLSGWKEVLHTDFASDTIFLKKIYTISIDKSKLSGKPIDLLMQQPNQLPVGNTQRYNYIVEPPVQTVYYNVIRQEEFYKSDCNIFSTGSLVVYTVAAKKYSSTISQTDADSKAQIDVNANGQNFANTTGSCILGKEIKTPKGTRDFDWSEYSENLMWDVSRITGQNVKIELFDKDASNQLILIADNIPNNGSLVNGLTKALGIHYSAKIKITSLDSGQEYFSDEFGIFQD